LVSVEHPTVRPAPASTEEARAVPQPRAVDPSFTIPTGYGDHRIVLMVKDPWWLYAYWEIRPDVERQARRQVSQEDTGGLRSVLRVYDVTARRFPEEPAHQWFDVTLSGLATNWYLHTNAPNRSFIVDLGLLTRTGRFITLARSNRVTTPRFGPSEILDEAWMVSDEDYWKLFGLTAGIGMGASPSGLKALLEQQLASPGFFSPGLFSPKTEGQTSDHRPQTPGTKALTSDV